MPLTLNLLHEEQKQLQARQRDPLKLGILVLAGVALLFAGYYIVRLIGAGELTSRMHTLQAEWNKLEPAAAAVDAEQSQLKTTVDSGAAVSRRIENRFYWAPILQTLQRTVPPAIQLTSFTGNNDVNGSRVSMILNGLAAGTEPRAAAEQFRIALSEALSKDHPGASASFHSLEETKEMATLDGKPLATAKFNIDVQLKKAGAEPEQTSARARHK